MTYEEYELEMEKLSKAKKGFDGNRTLCVAVVALVIYYAVKDDGLKTTPWYILLILGLVALCGIGIFVKDCIQIQKISKRIKELEKIDISDKTTQQPDSEDKA